MSTDAVKFQFVQQAVQAPVKGPDKEVSVPRESEPKREVLQTVPTLSSKKAPLLDSKNFMKNTFATVYGPESPVEDYDFMDCTI